MAEQEYFVVGKLSIKEIRRFFTNVSVDPSSQCWVWIGELNHASYGKFFFRGRKVKAHRLTYAWLIAAIPRGGGGRPELDHVVCNNHSCCNPAHLRLVSHAENMKRTTRRHCRRGHPLSEARILVRKNRWRERICRVCERVRSAEYRARKRGA